MSHKPRLNIDALIFSLDDVLVDATNSYREVVCQTVQLYLEQAVGLPPARESLLTVTEVVLLQKLGRFTDYWDLATALVMYFVEMLPPVPVPTFPSKLHVPALIAYLQLAGGRLQISLENLRAKKTVDRTRSQITGESKWDRYRHVIQDSGHDRSPAVEQQQTPQANVSERRAIYIETAMTDI